jgi:SpoVK/Ycf46/Vps4 family AAA+-type ATPase
VVIDEVDAIAPERKDGSEELAQRIVGTLLKLMDEGGQKRVLVIAATNRPDALDPALRRPGRFDRELEIGVPTPQGRQEILEALLCEMKHTLCVSEVQELAAGTHGFVGADLASLCHEAALSALRRSIIFSKSRRQDSMSSLCTQLEVASLDEKSGSTYPKDQHFVLEVTLEDFEVAKTRVRPSAMREVSSIVLPELTAVH